MAVAYREQEQKIVDLNAVIEAFRESVRSKDDLILKMCNDEERSMPMRCPNPLSEDRKLTESYYLGVTDCFLSV